MRWMRRHDSAPRTTISSACAFAGLCSAAADRCREQAGGVVGHHGCDGSDAGSRISRYGVVAQGWAENIAYGQRSARAIVVALIVDDGMRGRDHRRNIFSPNTTRPERLTVRMPDTTVFAVSILSDGYAEGAFMRAGTDAANSF